MVPAWEDMLRSSQRSKFSFLFDKEKSMWLQQRKEQEVVFIHISDTKDK